MVLLQIKVIRVTVTVILISRALVQDLLADETKDELVLEWGNGFQRLLLHQMLEADFDNKAYIMLRPTEKRNREIVVFKGGENEKRVKQLEQLTKDEIALKNNSGFLSVLTSIKDSVSLNNIIFMYLLLLYWYLNNFYRVKLWLVIT